MRTLLIWMFATTILVGTTFGQNTNAPQGHNAHDSWIRQPPAPPYAVGYNVVGDGSSNLLASPSIIDATAFTGTDACAKIAAALAVLPNSSGTVDARGFTGTQACGSNPFSTFTGQATVLLGAALYQATTTWVIPNRSRVFGIGAAIGTTGNTVIQWNGSTGNVPVVQLGSGSSANFGVFVGDLTIDCKASTTLTGMTGLLNNISQEESGANDITFLSCDKYAVDLQPGSNGGSENSGPYTNLNIKYPNTTSCSSSTIAFNYAGSTKRGINGLTVVADSCTAQPAVGVDVNGSGVASGPSADVLQGIHCEHVGDYILIGDSKPTNNTVVAGVTGCPSNGTCTNVVHIASDASDVVVEGVGANNGSSNLLKDDVTGNTITSSPTTPSNLAFYALGHSITGTSGTVAPNVITSDPTVVSQFNSHIGGNNDIAGTCTLVSGSCTVGFINNYNHKPVCTANSEGTSTNALKVATAINGLQITSSSSADTSTVGYICIGNPN